jgi:hypothetical protein
VGLVEEQGLLGLVEDDDGIVGLVEEADEFVGVVCPDAALEINEKAAAATKIARMFQRLSKRSLGRRSFPCAGSRPDRRFVDISAERIRPMFNLPFLAILSFDDQVCASLELPLAWMRHIHRGGDESARKFLACAQPRHYSVAKFRISLAPQASPS